jgi:hypothetical protein
MHTDLSIRNKHEDVVGLILAHYLNRFVDDGGEIGRPTQLDSCNGTHINASRVNKLISRVRTTRKIGGSTQIDNHRFLPRQAIENSANKVARAKR